VGTEFTINQELGSVCATAAELTAITQTVTRFIKSESFIGVFQPMVKEITKCYELLTHNMTPFIDLTDEASFNQSFDELYARYKDDYLNEVSKPRTYSEAAYELHLELKRLDESKTNYPILKRTFARLDELINKWIDNDVWLAMSIDNILKMLQRLLNEIAELKRQDPEEAFLVYNSAMAAFKPFVQQLDEF